MTESTNKKTLERIDRLERQNRNMKMVGVTSFILGTVCLFAWAFFDNVKNIDADVTKGDDKKKIVEAEEFILFDSNGKKRAELKMWKMRKSHKPTPALILYNEEGNISMILEAGSTVIPSVTEKKGAIKPGSISCGPCISLFDKKKGPMPVATLKADNGLANLTFYNPNSIHPRVNIGLRFDGNPTIGLYNKHMTENIMSFLPRIAIGLESDGNPSIELSDRNIIGNTISMGLCNHEPMLKMSSHLTPHIMLGICGKEKISTMWLADRQGDMRILMSGEGVSEDNGGVLNLYNKTGENVVELRVDEYGNGIVGAYNRKGLGRALKPGP